MTLASILESLYKLLSARRDEFRDYTILGESKDVLGTSKRMMSIWDLLISKSDTDNDVSPPKRYVKRQLSGKLSGKLVSQVL